MPRRHTMLMPIRYTLRVMSDTPDASCWLLIRIMMMSATAMRLPASGVDEALLLMSYRQASWRVIVCLAGWKYDFERCYDTPY